MLEICVDSAADLTRAIAGGADRIELCGDLSQGGLTPAADLLAAARHCPVPVHVMVRPRGGDFIYARDEVDTMAQTIGTLQGMGFPGVILGAETGGRRLDREVLQRLAALAEGMDLTLHRVADGLPDPVAAVGLARELGFARILTSGGAETAVVGRATIARMRNAANGAVAIMAGGGVRAESVAPLAALGVTEFHASCRAPGSAQLDPSLLHALRQAVDGAGLSRASARVSR